MFKYKLNNFYNVNDFTENYLNEYLKAIGIKNIINFLNPHEEDELSPFLLENMEKGVKLMREVVDKELRIVLIVDSDPDGYTSSAIFYNYFKTLYPNISIDYILHEGKEHGVELEKLPTDYDVIVIPDAGSSQKEELLKLANEGKYILVLDHHESDVSIEHDNIVIINNQLSPKFSNKALSGSGITFKFVEAYDTAYNNGQLWKRYYDIAALGIISDVMYSGNLDNNYIITKGLSNINNKMIQALLNKQSYSVSSATSPNKIDIAFYITPVLNGVIRIGTQEEKDLLFLGLAEEDKDRVFETTYRGETRVENFYEYIARTSVNIKSRQDNLINKTVEKIFKKIEEQGLQKNQLIIYKTSLEDKNEIPKVLTGLIAMKICAKYNRCTLVLRPQLVDGVQYYMGSGRGKKAEGFDSLREFCTESGLVEFAQG